MITPQDTVGKAGAPPPRREDVALQVHLAWGGEGEPNSPWDSFRMCKVSTWCISLQSRSLFITGAGDE